MFEQFAAHARRQGITDTRTINRLWKEMSGIIRNRMQTLTEWHLEDHVAGYKVVVLDDRTRADRAWIESNISPIR